MRQSRDCPRESLLYGGPTVSFGRTSFAYARGSSVKVHSRIAAVLAFAALALPFEPWSAVAADHGDTPLLTNLGRSDAKLTDLHVFVRGDKLVLAVSTNPAVPPSAADYVFPSDVVFKIFIDPRSEVSFDDTSNNEIHGGTVVRPDEIKPRVRVAIRLKAKGKPTIKVRGLKGEGKGKDNKQPCCIPFFAGLRDDPFIRGPRQGRNVGSIVLELPLNQVLRGRSTLLVWATSQIVDDEIPGPFQDLAGSALRSMFPENDLMNSESPWQHKALMGVAPDVVIYDTSLPAAFPNGRELADDVVDLVGDPRITGSDSPFPTTNDRPFLDGFPYLATPHPPR